MLLAERGASVVVNDLGGSIEGTGSDAGPADEVVATIAAGGGTAVADTSDVSSAAGAQALVDAAVGQFGRLDILINNAGIMRWAGFPRGRRGQPGRASRRAHGRLVQHGTRPPGRTWSSRATAASS